jgi:hypothetical protein
MQENLMPTHTWMITKDASALSAMVLMMLVLAATLSGVAVTDLMLNIARFRPPLLCAEPSTYIGKPDV